MTASGQSEFVTRVGQHASDGLVFLAEDGVRRSYADLLRLAMERAAWWRAKDRRIAFAGRDAFDLAAWVLAAETVGGTLLLLPADPDEDRLVRKSIAVGASHLAGTVPDLPPIPTRRQSNIVVKGLARVAGVWRGNRRAVTTLPFAVLFTSGSEGAPKGVCWTSEPVAVHLGTYERCLAYRQGERLFNALPLHHTDGFFHGPLMAMWSGLMLVRPSATFGAAALADWADLVKESGLDVFVTVPTMLAMLESLSGNPFSRHLSTARLIVSSAEPLPQALGARVEAAHAPVANIYGMTETINGGLFRLPGSGFPVASVGQPVDVEARLSDDGRLELRGPAMADGYEIGGRLTPLPRDAGGWWRTNDLARQEADGSWTILGRADSVVMIGGVNVHLGAVAAAANGIPGVQAAAATVEQANSALAEPVLVLHVETSASLTERALRAALADMLQGPAMPKRVVFHTALPRLASGKVDRQSLRGFAVTSDRLAAQEPILPDDLDLRLYQIAVEALNLPPGIALRPDMTADDIPQWDSFGHINFALAVEKAFGFRMKFNDLASIRSLSDMRGIVEANTPKETQRKPGGQ
jgi:acyl-CoA synthetase (AMP-forming)/AMP-acid ligase II/acyl carrier protein